MALRCKMNDAVHIIFGKDLIDRLRVTDIRTYKCIVIAVLHILQVLKIACVCKLIDIDDPDLIAVLFEHIMNIIRPDKSGTASYDIRSHKNFSLKNCELLIILQSNRCLRQYIHIVPVPLLYGEGLRVSHDVVTAIIALNTGTCKKSHSHCPGRTALLRFFRPETGTLSTHHEDSVSATGSVRPDAVSTTPVGSSALTLTSSRTTYCGFLLRFSTIFPR